MIKKLDRKKTWRQNIEDQKMSWPEFRDAILDVSPMELVNLDRYYKLYQDVISTKKEA